MDTFRTHAPRLLAGFGTAALVAGVGLFASSRPARTAGGPVPVSVTNTVPVTALAPLPTTAADAPAKQGVQFSVNLTIPDGQTGVSNPTVYTVPAGKRLVIETINSSANAFGDTDHYSIAYETVGGLGGADVLGYFTELPDGSPYSAGASHPHQYADAGSSVLAELNRTETGGSSGITVTFTGYLVDISGPGGS